MREPLADLELSETVSRYFGDTRHAGRPANAAAFGFGEAGSARGGAWIQLWLREDAGRIAEARFEAFGCPSTLACAAWLCEWLVGRAPAEAGNLTGLALAEALSLAPAKRGVALVAEDALRAALITN